jgi:uncharacterized membrane protein
MKLRPFLLLATLLFAGLTPLTSQANSGRSSGVDLAVTDFEATYTDATDAVDFRVFSSAQTSGRNDDLYVIDGLLNHRSDLSFTIENKGTTSASNAVIWLSIQHDEYGDFEIYNTSKTANLLNPGSSEVIVFKWNASYSGNHTMKLFIETTVIDDDMSNNNFQRHLTIGYSYDVFDDLSPWALGNSWSQSSDTALSTSNSLHVGNGPSSNYAAGISVNALTPIMDLSDGHLGSNRASGFAFFYTGSLHQSDTLRVLASNSGGGWDALRSYTGLVDNGLLSNWNTVLGTSKGHSSPIIPFNAANLHANSQLKFEFTSDSTNQDLGYWIDDFVILYDQKAKDTEFGLQASVVAENGALPGHVSKNSLRITNTGNVTDTYSLSVESVPSDHVAYFTHTSGATISSAGVSINPGESKDFELRILLDENSSMGADDVTVTIQSMSASSIKKSVIVSVSVLATNIPNIILPAKDARCLPGSSCTFAVEVENIGAASGLFDIEISEKNTPDGWTFSLSWNQSNQLTIDNMQSSWLWFSATIPEGTLPDTQGDFWLTVTPLTDEDKAQTLAVKVKASMVSLAELAVAEFDNDKLWLINAGDTVVISFTVWNNASRLDSFKAGISYQERPGWVIEILDQNSIAINSQSSGSFRIKITSPSNSQAGDRCPSMIASITSTLSDEVFEAAEWDEIEILTRNDIVLDLVDMESKISPGTPFPINISIENDGNGPALATFEMIDLPSTWHWWALTSEEVNVTDGIELSVSYELNDFAEITIWVLPPILESPGIYHQFKVGSYAQGSTDLNLEDNIIDLTVITESVREPFLEGELHELTAKVGSTVVINMTAWNMGNSEDYGAKARIKLTTSPDNQGVIGFLLSSGLDAEVDQWLNLNMEAGGSRILSAEIVILDSVELNSRITLTFEMVGGDSDDLVTIEKSHTIIVTDRRSLTVSQMGVIDSKNIETISLPFTIDLISTSTIAENLTVSGVTPSGWGLICDGIALHLEDTEVLLPPGHLSEQEYNFQCLLIRESGAFLGEMKIRVVSDDGEIDHLISHVISWDVPIGEEVSSSLTQESVVGIGGIIIILIISLLVIVLRRDSNEHEEEDFTKPESGPPAHFTQTQPEVVSYEQPQVQQPGYLQPEVQQSAYAQPQQHSSYSQPQVQQQLPSGPPASAGPPATTVSAVAEVAIDTPATAYEREMAEYHRKMAEWNARQGQL